METVKYCTFIDVLGYGNLVTDSEIPTEKKVRILNNIYSNMAANISCTINDINAQIIDKVFIRSFSDAFYLECDRIEPIIIVINQIFNDIFGFNTYSENDIERTPLLRGGIVKDWTVKFKDIGGMINGISDFNPVGLGVARAYWTSERSNLSGMRIIISKEVFADLSARKLNKFSNCFGLEILENETPIPYYFRRIDKDDKDKDDKDKDDELYELIWSYQGMNSCTYEYIDELEKLEKTFKKDSRRHFVGTAKVLLAGLLLTDCSITTENKFQDAKIRLENIIKS